ncbi:MAG: hypothetical protein CMP19_10825 [Rickettsiales bacterium]|nr:hypothetical protein [Rickettsiales bacterium]
MSTRKVIDAIAQVRTTLVDTTGTRWPDLELLNGYNNAVLAVVNLRPDASTKNISFTTEAGKSKQVLPSDGLRWMDIVYDVASGNPIRKTDRTTLDDQIPNWHNSVGNRVTNWVFDERDPKTAYVYPQPADAVEIQIIYSVAPSAVNITDFENDTTTISIDDSYFNAIKEYMLYEAYSKDADYASNASRAAAHYNKFERTLGNKSGVDKDANLEERK